VVEVVISILGMLSVALAILVLILRKENRDLWEALDAREMADVAKKVVGGKEELTQSKHREEDKVKPRSSAEARMIAESLNREWFSAEKKEPNSERMRRNG